ncbi:hypothetical protein DERF_011875 [Dermatophagoides farinae]|uniref:Uncharacterized protein n=1 Tax=Dermatophagoides farinae TaxID=6954 RepID=A0A922KXG8_DERFA|nr:hypothetical protein DERF_011875 [Dermatophagoides farinae]
MQMGANRLHTYTLIMNGKQKFSKLSKHLPVSFFFDIHNVVMINVELILNKLYNYDYDDHI